MGFVEDLLNERLKFKLFESSLECFKLAEELLRYYNIDFSTKDFVEKHTMYLDIYSEKVLRLLLINRNLTVGAVSFTKRFDNTYEIGYYVLEKYRGKSNVSSYLDTVYDVCKRNYISLSAKVNVDNKKSIYLIEKHLRLKKSFVDNRNNIIIYGGQHGKSNKRAAS